VSLFSGYDFSGLLGGYYYLWWVFSHPWCAVVALLFGYVSRCPIVLIITQQDAPHPP
jgi:hypothetical protein